MQRLRLAVVRLSTVFVCALLTLTGAPPRVAAQSTRMHIDALAQRIDAKAGWDDIVLPAPEMALLRQIAAHVSGRGTVYGDWGFRKKMNRGLGISALFAGASGTGKTMAAEVIANELGLALHRIDLSSVVSKWVGETEKNLERVFQVYYSTKRSGTGLGLPTARRYVEEHDGTIELQSEVGRGTRVTIALPRKGPVRDPASADVREA